MISETGEGGDTGNRDALRVVFMGTAEFAVPALAVLHGSRHDLLLVVTQPDRRGGRGRKLHPSPVKKEALEMGCPVAQPEEACSDAFCSQLAELSPDVLVVAAYGQILTAKVLSIPRFGAINIHPSLLPLYRGPAPIQWAIIDRAPETGVTTMLLDEGMDTGDILLTRKTPIAPAETAGVLHHRLAIMGAELLMPTIDGVHRGDVIPRPQDHERATYAPLLTKADGHIDWATDAETIEARIRGVTPWPGAFTFHGDKRLKIFRADVARLDTAAPPGTVVPGFPDELRVAAGKGALAILEVQGASGKRMDMASFLRGYDLPAGSRLR